MIVKSAARNFVVVKDEVSDRRIKIYFACDKGNKKGISHFVKYIAYWSAKEKRVKKALLDIDALVGTSEA